MTQIGSPFILLMFAARSGAIFIAVKYADVNAPTTFPATRRGGDVDVAEQRLVPCIGAHALHTCRAIPSICAMTVWLGLNGESMPPPVTHGSFFDGGHSGEDHLRDARAKLPLGVHGKHHVRHERVTGDVLEQTVKIPVVE